MLLINNGRIVNEGRVYKGSILVKDGKIEAIYKDAVPNNIAEKARIINAEDCWILPGVIDTHVHFRDPGLTHKGDLLTESKAAAAGGVTSIMDMPNTNPQTITVQ
ncbi:MAG: amidohydrolase family protein, partial [Paludibacteraceae bacterium]|nr:amidohydrolase family protein [Paludibacteraceae bacterium]